MIKNNLSKPIKYHREDYEGLICFICDTDFSKYSYSPDLTIFKKGWYRDKMDKFVLKITNIMIPHENSNRVKTLFFDTQKEALNYIKLKIKELEKC